MSPVTFLCVSLCTFKPVAGKYRKVAKIHIVIIIKVALQLEFGKHVINSGESTFASFNLLPGLRLGRANWTIWTWLVIMILKFIQVGGIVGGVALTLNIAFPNVGISVWAWLVALSVALLVFRGYYRSIEKIALAIDAREATFLKDVPGVVEQLR